MDREKFLKWISSDINPKRVRDGLDEISEEDAKLCYEIMEDFLQKWEEPDEKG
jgi:hypothetical protein